MRLTLRTLLAYLDDVLPPEQAKELGQKLGDSNYATALVDRIKDVMRRRRLSAPELFGKAAGIDPNVVADYLDNELTPNDVGDVEKICLDSDVHLAEVAACHQILTLVLGEPVDVRSETRARMYALGPVPAKDSLRANDSAPMISMGTAHRPPMTVEPVVAASLQSSVDRTVPDYLKSESSWRKTALIVLVVLVLGGWIGLLLRDQTLNLFRGNTDKTVAEGQSKPREAADSQPNPNDQTTPQVVTKDVEPAVTRQPPTDTNLAANRTATNRTPLEADRRNNEVPARRETASSEAPLNAPIPRGPKATDNAATTDEVPTQAEEPQTLPALRLLYSAREGRLLHWDAKAADYVVLPNRSELRPHDRLACPEPFRADISIEDDLAHLTMIGGTAVTLTKPTERASLGFDIAQGALLIESKGAAAAATSDPGNETEPKNGEAARKKLPISIVLHDRSYHLELAASNSVCAIEVHRGEPIRYRTPPEGPGLFAALHVVSGTVKLTKHDGQAEELVGPAFFPLVPEAGAQIKPGEPNQSAFATFFDWLDSDSKKTATRTKSSYKIPFEKEFDPEQPLLLTMPAIINNPRPALSELAVKCLALTDSYSPLAKALVTAEHREARLAAITGLRHWLASDPKHETPLTEELERHLTPQDSEAVVRLLWGFNLADAKNPATSRQLVGWLEHDQIAIRELAFFHIHRLTGLKNDYSPINPPGQRRSAVDRWHAHLEKKGGALVMP